MVDIIKTILTPNLARFCTAKMSQIDVQVEKYEYIHTTYSCGDTNKKKTQLYQEENNNEVDELSKEFSEMGCIVDVVKQPPNVCVERCVYESESETEKSHAYETENNEPNENEDVHYSDEFEEDDSVIEETQAKNISTNSINKTESNTVIEPSKSSVKLAKSQLSMSSNKPPSLSGRSSGYGSVSVPPTRRINMSFTNERLREIERHNHILLNKILSARNSKKLSISSREMPIKRSVPPAAVHRRLQQRKIDHDNMILLKKIQRAKSSDCSVRR